MAVTANHELPPQPPAPLPAASLTPCMQHVVRPPRRLNTEFRIRRPLSHPVTGILGEAERGRAGNPRRARAQQTRLLGLRPASRSVCSMKGRF